ncbi:hypothetical protein JCM9957A_66010 [Kineosporia succinea]
MPERRARRVRRRTRSVRPDWLRPDWLRPDWLRPDWLRPDWLRPDWTRPDWTRPDWTRPDWTRPGRAGPDRTGPDRWGAPDPTGACPPARTNAWPGRLVAAVSPAGPADASPLRKTRIGRRPLT